MEVKQGYKYTEEFGYIPEDWEVFLLDEIAKINAKNLLSNVDKEFTFYYLDLSMVTNGKIIYPEKVIRFSEAPLRAKRVINEGDVIFSTVRPYLLGHGVCRKKVNNLIGSTGFAVISSNSIAINEIIFQFFFFKNFFNQIEKVIVGSNYPALSSSQVKKIKIALPILAGEQEKIAQVLRDMDKLIESIEALLEKKRNLKIAAMQKLLTPQPHWEEKRMGEFTQICTGKENNENKVDNGLYPFFVRSDRIERINHYAFDGEAILIPGEGGIGKIFHYINGKFNYHQRVYKISHINLNGKFLFYYLKKYFGAYALSNTVKATVDSLRLDTFQSFNVLFPSLQEQQKIAQILSDMDEEIDALEKELEKFRMIKTGTMQELLTGKTRLL